MNAIDASPSDWLCNLLKQQPEVRDVEFDVPPNMNRILLTTTNGQRLALSIGSAVFAWWNEDA